MSLEHGDGSKVLLCRQWGFKNCFGFDRFMSRRMVEFFWIVSAFFCELANL